MAVAQPEPRFHFDALAEFVELVARRPAWQAHAACRGRGPDDWYPTRGASQQETLHRARQVCAGCPVRDQCVDFAAGDGFGVWGGMTVRERQRRRAAAARTAPVAAPAPPERAPKPTQPPPAVPRRRSATGPLAGGPAAVPLESVYSPDSLTIEQWRRNRTGGTGRTDLERALSAISAALGRQPQRGTDA
jgi:WhiB family redox-sensing transcriptional regulator